MASKAYTPQEMREAADNFWVGGVICEVKDEQGRVVKQIKDDAVIAMLRQAADTLDGFKTAEYWIRLSTMLGWLIAMLEALTIIGMLNVK